MSWLNPDKIPPSGYNPNRRVESLIEQYGETGQRLLECFNQIDPLHVFFGNNLDEYAGYVERFMNALGQRDIGSLNHAEVSALVRSSFHQEQIGKFASEEDVIKLIREIETELGIISALEDLE